MFINYDQNPPNGFKQCLALSAFIMKRQQSILWALEFSPALRLAHCEALKDFRTWSLANAYVPESDSLVWTDVFFPMSRGLLKEMKWNESIENALSCLERNVEKARCGGGGGLSSWRVVVEFSAIWRHRYMYAIKWFSSLFDDDYELDLRKSLELSCSWWLLDDVN